MLINYGAPYNKQVITIQQTTKISYGVCIVISINVLQTHCTNSYRTSPRDYQRYHYVIFLLEVFTRHSVKGLMYT